MPASLCNLAGSTRARSPSSSGRNLSDLRLTPPPTMNSSGQSSASRWLMYSWTRPAQCSQSRLCTSLARSEARFSASLPRISMWPNSVFGTSIPLMNSALPMPVPKVSMTTVPCCPAPAPNCISALPAASASLMIWTSSPVAEPNRSRAFTPIQAGSRLAAVRMTPSVTTPGKVIPALPDQPNCSTRPRTASATALGLAGCGVGTLIRSRVKAPAVTSTGAALIPEPPISTPRSSTRLRPLLMCRRRHRDGRSGRRLQAPACRAELADGVGVAVEPYLGRAGPPERPQDQFRRVAGYRDHRRPGPCRHSHLPLAAAVSQVVPSQFHPNRRAAEQQLARRQPLPERVGQPSGHLAGLPPVRPAPYVLVMDEELHQVEPFLHAREPVDRQRRRPGADQLHQVRERGAAGQHLGYPAGVARQRPAHQPGRRVRPAFPHHQVRGQVHGAPALAQRRRPRPCLIKQGTQGRALVAGIAHPAMVRPAQAGGPPSARRIGG